MAFIEKNFPGIIYAVVIAMIAFAIQFAEEAVLGKGRALIEGLVIAILLGMVVRAVLGLNKRFAPGVGFTAKQVLEFAVLLLGLASPPDFCPFRKCFQAVAAVASL